MHNVLNTIHLLLEVLQEPDPIALEKFLGKIPNVFNVVIFSPHGYFGQADVLGLPDTGGQVSYVMFSSYIFHDNCNSCCFFSLHRTHSLLK